MSPVKETSVKELIEICTNILDQSLLHTLSPTSEIWEIVGATELSDLHIDPNGEVCVDRDIPIEVLPRYTGLTIESILKIIKENRNLFDFDNMIFKSSGSCKFYIQEISYREFLMDEVRSKDLHVKYRNSVVHALKSRIAYIKKLGSAELCVSFSILKFMVNAVTYWF